LQEGIDMKLTTASSFIPTVLLVLLLSACAEDTGQQQEAVKAERSPEPPDCQLTMGWDPWEPYQYVTPTGEVAGLDVELIEAAAHHAGCALTFEQHDFVTLLNKLRNGEVDFVPGATRTEARETFAWFSIPYREEVFTLFVRSEDKELYADDDLESLLKNRRRVGFTEGFMYGEEAEALMAEPDYQNRLVSARIGDLNLLRLIEHDIDALIEDNFVAASVQRRLGISNRVAALDQVLQSANVRLMFSRDSVDEDTVERMNEGLKRVIEDGTRERIISRYKTD
jgi:polar amino acid transport system substrate-binding protein